MALSLVDGRIAAGATQTAPPPKRTVKPLIDRDEYERAKLDAAAVAAVDEPLAAQLQRRQREALGGAPQP